LEVLLALLLVRSSAQVCLSSGLPADLQRAADLAPIGSLGTGGEHQQINRVVDAVLGVSCGLEVLQRALRASLCLLQLRHCSADQPSGLGAGVGAHDNRGCQSLGRFGAKSLATLIAELLTEESSQDIANSCKHRGISGRSARRVGPAHLLD
jgi:hypothetical protein